VRNLDVGIVVPTLGERPHLLNEALNSIRRAGECTVVLVTPKPRRLELELDSNLYDGILLDPGKGLSQAIDYGIRSMPVSVEYTNWLGDDDLLTEHSIAQARNVLCENQKVSLVYGRCQYIDYEGRNLWLNKSGSWATTVMRFGPQLVAQPGALFRLENYKRVGGLNPELKWAFDLDLFMRLSRIGDTRYIPVTLAKFRWHSESLSVGNRSGSVAEASRVRVAALPRYLRWLAALWEKPMQRVINDAGIKIGAYFQRQLSRTQSSSLPNSEEQIDQY